MNYTRVIPRDLFNEASLLKCLGRLSILLDETPNSYAELDLKQPESGFVIAQNPGDGSIFVTNLSFKVVGRNFRLSRSLNARSAWPLWVEYLDKGDIEVFTEKGDLTEEMRNFIQQVDV